MICGALRHDYICIMNKRLRIVFMGTPDFALPTLQILLSQGYDIPVVITAPDKAAGRGLKKRQSTIKLFALSEKIDVWQPINLKDESFQSELKLLNADLFIVVAFRILPDSVLDIPKLGSINLHASLLPQYRGAAPINWAIINGEKESGVTTFFIKAKVDTGDILMQKKIPIHSDDDSELLHDKLMLLGAETMLETVKLIESGHYKPIPQQSGKELKPAPKIYRELGELKASMSAQQAYNLIRGLSPHPACFFNYEGKQIKIYKTNTPENKLFGDRFFQKHGGKIYLHFFDASLEITSLQQQGKKRMSADDFIKGFRF